MSLGRQGQKSSLYTAISACRTEPVQEEVAKMVEILSEMKCSGNRPCVQGARFCKDHRQLSHPGIVLLGLKGKHLGKYKGQDSRENEEKTLNKGPEIPPIFFWETQPLALKAITWE